MTADRDISRAMPAATDIRTATLLGLLALALYLPAFWWGAPHATDADRVSSWGVDDATPLAPLAEVHNVFYPKPDRNLGYPLLHPFVLAAAYSPYLGYLWLSGQFGAPTGVYPYGLADPVTALKVLSGIARLLSVLMGAGIVVAAFLAAQSLWNRRTAVLAAFFAMTSYPMFYYSRTGNVDVPALFFIALALAVYARILAAGFTPRRAVWLGIFVGFALATKEPGLAAFIGLPFVLLPLHWRACSDSGAAGFSREFVTPLLLALVAAFLAFGLGSGLFVDPGRFFAHVEFVRGRMHAAAAGEVAFVKTFPYTWEGHVALARLLGKLLADAMTLPGLVLALLGVILTFWRATRMPARQNLIVTAFALPAITYLLVLFFSARVAQLRYIMPAAWVLAFFAAYAVTSAREVKLPLVRPLAFLFAGWVITLGLLRGVDLTYAMVNDSRYDAAAWLRSHTKPGMRVEFFGPDQKLPALEPEVVSARAITYLGAVARPRTQPEAVREILDGWIARRPDFILSIPDHSSPSGFQDSATCPPPIYAGLMDGTIGYRLAAQFHTPALLPWVRRPALDYPSVNPPVRIFARADSAWPSASPPVSAGQGATQ